MWISSMVAATRRGYRKLGHGLCSLCPNNSKNMMKKFIAMAVVALMATMTLTSCSDDDDENIIIPTPEEPVVLNCAKPDYLNVGDKVAMISPSYFTPMETIEKAADVFRSWGLEPVLGPNVDKVLDGKIGGTVEERVSDIRWALTDPSSRPSSAIVAATAPSNS